MRLGDLMELVRIHVFQHRVDIDLSRVKQLNLWAVNFPSESRETKTALIYCQVSLRCFVRHYIYPMHILYRVS